MAPSLGNKVQSVSNSVRLSVSPMSVKVKCTYLSPLLSRTMSAPALVPVRTLCVAVNMLKERVADDIAILPRILQCAQQLRY